MKKLSGTELARYVEVCSRAGGIAFFGSHPKDYDGNPDWWLTKNLWRFKVDLSDLLDAKMPLRSAEDVQGGCGVYFLFLGDKLQYVGQSKDIRYRLGQHLYSMRPILPLADWFDSVAAIWVPREFLDAVESAYIHRLNPPKNVLPKPLTDWSRKVAGIRQRTRRITTETRQAMEAASLNQEVSPENPAQIVPSSAL